MGHFVSSQKEREESDRKEQKSGKRVVEENGGKNLMTAQKQKKILACPIPPPASKYTILPSMLNSETQYNCTEMSGSKQLR